MFQSKKAVLFALISVVANGPAIGFASEIYSPVVAPVSPAAADVVPDVARVPGKLFTDSLDMNYVPSPHQLSSTQIGEFDGLGGARNGLRLADFNPELSRLQIDAQSQVRDVLFDAVVANRAPLIISTSFDQLLGSDTALAAERTDGSVQSFATSSQVVNHAHRGRIAVDSCAISIRSISGGERGNRTPGFTRSEEIPPVLPSTRCNS